MDHYYCCKNINLPRKAELFSEFVPDRTGWAQLIQAGLMHGTDNNNTITIPFLWHACA